MWAGAFVEGLYPLGSDGFFADVGPIGCLLGLILVVSLGFVWIAEKIGLPSGNPRTLSSMTRRARWPLAIAVGGMLLLPLAPPLGTRLGGRLGLAMQPVRDLIQSPAVAKLAASGDGGNLPETEWPASLREWKTDIWSVSVNPRPGLEPEIMVIVGYRGSRYDQVVIHPAMEPRDDDDRVFTRWAPGVWLVRLLGE